MTHTLRIYILLFSIQLAQGQTDITTQEIYDHIAFLASTESAGRYPGGKKNKRVVAYIAKDFKKSGVQKVRGTYRQKFKATLRIDSAKKAPVVSTFNVIGTIQGSDSLLKNEYIVLGAHYDHLGLGGPSSKSEQRHTVHPGADDNASGTAALLEIAEKLASVKNRLDRSVLFIAFGAEEQGLLGSKYFVENSPISIDQIKLMINMDMVGRLNDRQQIYMGGAGTFPKGQQLMKDLGKESDLNPLVHAGSVGGSDHVSFYKKNISVLGIHTGGHPQYHTPEDTLDLIDLEGEKMVCDYIFNTILTLASSDYPLYFIPQD
ncbi:M28 family metallopeptidase [Pareuzebyella sediminis]|uniref:M28 family metallopeptidase n=1 Tax=Pareuzebyella sediminis TaxID=2607998 RepID=UPI0011F0935E|nr:M20/M25/M40 family metallo-hydrolase [Pareuzebyella sediminis]